MGLIFTILEFILIFTVVNLVVPVATEKLRHFYYWISRKFSKKEPPRNSRYH